MEVPERPDRNGAARSDDLSSFCSVRLSTELAVAVSAYLAMLYGAVLGGRCRFVKSRPLWACLPGMALQHRHLDTAELALAAIEDVRRGPWPALYAQVFASA